MNRELKKGDVGRLTDRSFKNEMVEVIEPKGSQTVHVKIISHGFSYYANEANIVKIHGDCVEQLTTRENSGDENL